MMTICFNSQGERLSHAVGCAFAVCLERKKKRDEETAQHVKKLAEQALNPTTWDDQPSRYVIVCATSTYHAG